jgi:predicted nucleic acid-binding protein
MIYVDSSIVLAELFSETRRPKETLWSESLVSSRLTEYEVWNRAHAYGVAAAAEESIASLLDRVAFVELSPIVLTRAKQKWSKPVRTLDALHLATCDYLARVGKTLALASFDDRLNDAARALGLPLHA